jgi:hypothetical protein
VLSGRLACTSFRVVLLVCVGPLASVSKPWSAVIGWLSLFPSLLTALAAWVMLSN